MTHHDDLTHRLRVMVSAKGGALYGGEKVTQEQHALQCAQAAENEGASAALVTAALLHDVGHLLEDDFGEAIDKGEDRRHEDLGETFLKQWFGSEVTEPVRLHVAAKRYLCATDPDYFSRLSPASVRTLELQGGPMDEREIAEFEAHPHWRDAVRLRVWDDEAKDPEAKPHDLEHFLRCVRQSVAA